MAKPKAKLLVVQLLFASVGRVLAYKNIRPQFELKKKKKYISLGGLLPCLSKTIRAKKRNCPKKCISNCSSKSTLSWKFYHSCINSITHIMGCVKKLDRHPYEALYWQVMLSYWRWTTATERRNILRIASNSSDCCKN